MAGEAPLTKSIIGDFDSQLTLASKSHQVITIDGNVMDIYAAELKAPKSISEIPLPL